MFNFKKKYKHLSVRNSSIRQYSLTKETCLDHMNRTIGAINAEAMAPFDVWPGWLTTSASLKGSGVGVVHLSDTGEWFLLSEKPSESSWAQWTLARNGEWYELFYSVSKRRRHRFVFPLPYHFSEDADENKAVFVKGLETEYVAIESYTLFVVAWYGHYTMTCCRTGITFSDITNM